VLPFPTYVNQLTVALLVPPSISKSSKVKTRHTKVAHEAIRNTFSQSKRPWQQRYGPDSKAENEADPARGARNPILRSRLFHPYRKRKADRVLPSVELRNEREASAVPWSKSPFPKAPTMSSLFPLSTAAVDYKPLEETSDENELKVVPSEEVEWIDLVCAYHGEKVDKYSSTMHSCLNWQ
jgi:hypothetical protein